jgi:glycerate kinase
MKIIIAPDKFKGSLTSIAVCIAIEEGLQHTGERLDIEYFPMADGGDGFADVMRYYTNTVTQQIQSVDALGRSIDSSYELNTHQSIAIIELASCSGLAMLRREERNPFVTSTYGTGLQIKDAIGRVRKKLSWE